MPCSPLPALPYQSFGLACVPLDVKRRDGIAEQLQKFAGLARELLVGQFTSGMFGLEHFVDDVQGGNRVAHLPAAHQRLDFGGCESPIEFGCYVAGFHSPRFAAPLLICDVGHQRLCGHEGGKDGECQKHDVHMSYCLNDAGGAQSKTLDGLSLAISCQRLAHCGHGQARAITITSAVPTLRAGCRPDLATISTVDRRRILTVRGRASSDAASGVVDRL